MLSWYRIILIVCKIQRRTCECCLGAHRVSSWSCYGLKLGIPWQFGFSLSLFLIILCLPVHENHKHVQDWNPTTTTSFPGIHNSNNNNIMEKQNKKLREKRKEVVVVWFQPWTFLWFSWTGRHYININKQKQK